MRSEHGTDNKGGQHKYKDDFIVVPECIRSEHKKN
jgi:hypothetical protein